jgi:ATP-binding protein involved in chromosome partitioning
MKGYHDIAGDGGSRVLEQVEESRSRIARNLARVTHLIAIGSGKGGVGKSTLTMQVALALRSAGAPVAILDADVNGPSQARLAGLPVTPCIPGERGISLPKTRAGIGVVSVGSWLPEPEPLEFPTVARGESQVWRGAKEFSMLGGLLAGVDWGELDYLLLDLPPGAERTLQWAEFLGARVAFVLVTHPSDLSRGVVARAASSLLRAGARVLGYVENMKGYACADCGRIGPLFPESGAIDLGVPCLGSVPFDPLLAALSDQGVADRAESSGRTSARAITEVARAIRRAAEATA